MLPEAVDRGHSSLLYGPASAQLMRQPGNHKSVGFEWILSPTTSWWESLIAGKAKIIKINKYNVHRIRTISRRSRLTIPWMLIILCNEKETTHYSKRVGWSRCCGCLSYMNGGWVRWGTLVWDLKVLLCPFPLGNCKCYPVERNKSINLNLNNSL